MDLSKIHVGVNRRTRKKRVGRGVGSGMGKTATRGHKGQYGSAGAKTPLFTFEGGQMPLFRRMPKRGFSHGSWDKVARVLNVGDLSDCFEDGATIDPEVLRETGLLKGQYERVRILGNGEVAKKLNIKAHHFSKSAQEKITAKGGTCELLPLPQKPVRNKMKPRPAKT